MINCDMSILELPLPENIIRLKENGSFSELGKTIDYMVTKGKLTDRMKTRLELEKIICGELEKCYIYSVEEAYEKLCEKIDGFTRDEFEEMLLSGSIEWIYINGEKKIFDRFFECLLKSDNGLRIRQKGKAAEAIVHGAKSHERAIADILRKYDDAVAADRTGHTAIAADSAVACACEDGSRDNGITVEKEYYIRLCEELRIKDEAFHPGTVAVHMPIPRNTEQLSEGEIIRMEPMPKLFSPDYHAQRTAFFCEELSENRCFTVEFAYNYRSVYRNLSTEVVSATKQPAFTAEELARHYRMADGCCGGMHGDSETGPDGRIKEPEPTAADVAEVSPHIRFSAFMKEVLSGILDKKSLLSLNALQRARAIYDYVTTKITYSYVRPYIAIESLVEYTVLRGRGDCGLQSLVFITLCRMAGIPARWQSGLYVDSEEGTAGCHDWAMFYIAPYGWLFADCSFGGSAYRKTVQEGIKAEDREKYRREWDFYFGSLDPFRMPANSDFQKAFYPAKQYLRMDPYDSQSGEAEYEDRGLADSELDSVTRIIEIREVPN